MRRRPGEDGFSLIEVMVSLALVSVLAIYTLNAISLQKNMNLQGQRIARQLEVNAVINALRQPISAMQLVFAPAQQGQRNLLFDGKEHSLSFAWVSDGSRLEGGLYRVTYLVDDAQRLVARFEAIKSSGFAPPVSVSVLDNVQSVSFRYFDVSGAKDGILEWRAQDRLPNRIEFKLIREKQSQQPADGDEPTSTAVVEMARL